MLSPNAQGDAILIADPSMAGEAIAAALRARSFAVIEVAAELLPARAVAEAPRVIVVDVDQPGALEAVERARDLCATAPPSIFCLGDPLRAAELGVTRAEGRVFSRPVDIGAVVAAVASVAAPRARGDRSPPTIAHRRPTFPPRAGDSDAPPPHSEIPASEMPGSGDAIEAATMLPSLEETATPSRLFAHEMSPELERVLVAAEQRVVTHHRPSSIPSPEEELDLLLPPDLLAALDEPLDPEEEGPGTGSGSGGGGTHAPRQHTTTGAVRGLSTVAETSAGAVRGAETSAGAVRGAITGAETSVGEGHATKSAFPMGSQTNVNAGTVPGTEQRFDPRSFAVTPETGIPVVPAAQRRSPSTLPPSAPDPPMQAIPAPDAASAIRPHVVVPVGRQGTSPLIRDGAAVPRFGAPVSDAAQSRASTAPTLPLFPPPPLAQPSFAQGPDAAADQDRSISAQETTSPGRSIPPPMPAVLAEADAVAVLARAVSARASGALVIGRDPAQRRIVLHDGDIVTAGSTAPDETLLAFLIARGDLPRELAARLGSRLPPFGRHAGAALIAHGHLGQDDLWPVLRAHAEWIIARALAEGSGTGEIEPDPPGRLRAEPNVFGGATGAEVLVEEVRRVYTPEIAVKKLGGQSARLAEGSRRALLAECALRREEEEIVRGAPGRTVAEVLKGAEADLASVLYALVALGVLDALAPAAPSLDEGSADVDPLDAEAIRQRVRARAALVEDGDYFSLLGVARSATGYEIKRAYLDLRRSFEPSRVLTAATADLAGEVRLILEVLDEAYEIMRDPHRRERYRRAIDAGPP